MIALRSFGYWAPLKRATFRSVAVRVLLVFIFAFTVSTGLSPTNGGNNRRVDNQKPASTDFQISPEVNSIYGHAEKPEHFSWGRISVSVTRFRLIGSVTESCRPKNYFHQGGYAWYSRSGYNFTLNEPLLPSISLALHRLLI